MRRYELAPGAQADIEALWAYIANQSVQAANGAVATIQDTLERLASFPEMGRKHPGFANNRLRFHATKHFTVLYRASEPIAIVRVLGRDMDSALE